MKLFFILGTQFLRAIATLTRPGGAKSLVAENLLLKQQLIVLNRPRKRAPQTSSSHRFLLGFLCHFLNPRRIQRVALTFRPSSLLRFHAAFKNFKYRLLFSPGKRSKPGPKGPTSEVIQAILEFKRRNPRFGCPRIAQQIEAAFGVEIDKDVVRRVLASHFRPQPNDNGPSWLTFLGHTKGSLWSMDLFRTESIRLQTHWVMVVMDQYSRRIIGFAVQPIAVDGPALCRMFNRIIATSNLPKRLSFDSDPLFRFEQWKANLRVLEIDPIRSVPNVPVSHPFIERLIGTIRREYLDHLFFWNAHDLERKLESFRDYYNDARTHQGIDGAIPNGKSSDAELNLLHFESYKWKPFCGGMAELPVAA
jgi:putative transposase